LKSNVLLPQKVVAKSPVHDSRSAHPPSTGRKINEKLTYRCQR
jgi:hypothetical protein